ISGTVTTSPAKAGGASRATSTGSGSPGFMPSGVALTTMPASPGSADPATTLPLNFDSSFVIKAPCLAASTSWTASRATPRSSRASAIALLVGAGGAGSAIALALLDRGVARLAVHDVDAARHGALITKLESKFKGRVVAGSAEPGDAGIVVNATPLGMKPGDPLPVDVARLAPPAFAGDVVTVPEMTPFLLAAREKGCRIQTGVDMFQGNLGLMADFFATGKGTG